MCYVHFAQKRMWLTKVTITSFKALTVYTYSSFSRVMIAENFIAVTEKRRKRKSMHHGRNIAKEAHDWIGIKSFFLFSYGEILPEKLRS